MGDRAFAARCPSDDARHCRAPRRAARPGERTRRTRELTSTRASSPPDRPAPNARGDGPHRLRAGRPAGAAQRSRTWAASWLAWLCRAADRQWLARLAAPYPRRLTSRTRDHRNSVDHLDEHDTRVASAGQRLGPGGRAYVSSARSPLASDCPEAPPNRRERRQLGADNRHARTCSPSGLRHQRGHAYAAASWLGPRRWADGARRLASLAALPRARTASSISVVARRGRAGSG